MAKIKRPHMVVMRDIAQIVEEEGSYPFSDDGAGVIAELATLSERRYRANLATVRTLAKVYTVASKFVAGK